MTLKEGQSVIDNSETSTASHQYLLNDLSLPKAPILLRSRTQIYDDQQFFLMEKVDHPLQQAFHHDLLDDFLDNNPVETTDIHGNTLLHTAVLLNDFDLVKTLVNKNSQIVEAANLQNMRPLNLAIELEYANITTFLAQSMPSLRNPYLQNAFCPVAQSIVKKDYRTFKILVDDCQAQLNRVDTCGRSLLHLAAQEGFVEIIEKLYQWGVTLDSKDNQGRTPLHIAAQNSHKNIVESLIKNGGNCLVNDLDGNTPLNLLMTTINCVYDLFDLAEESLQRIKLAAFLIEADPRALGIMNQEGHTPLFYAIKNNLKRLLLVMLKCNPLTYLDNKDSELIFMEIVRMMNINHINQFINQGAMATHLLHYRPPTLTPLIVAIRSKLVKQVCSKNYWDVIQTLVYHGDRLDRQLTNGPFFPSQYLMNNWRQYKAHEFTSEQALQDLLGPIYLGETGLHLLARIHESSTSRLGLLIEHYGKTNLNVKNTLGMTPLHVAVLSGNLVMVKLLLKYHALVDEMNEKGETALHLAAFHADHAVIQELLTHGAKMTAKSLSDQNSLHYLFANPITIKGKAFDILIAADVSLTLKDCKGISPQELLEYYLANNPDQFPESQRIVASRSQRLR